ncbi:MAG: DUF998 domain-containing protein [Candidatus Bathyarchaeota archaeon]|nr:MAG: DUF998 domain-containing protein [Candidatus Bathyarchaeota archaeon]
MQFNNRKTSGFLLFAGSVICILGIIIAEALHPAYSTSENYISDLGVGPAAAVFNFSVFLLGVLVALSSYFIQKTFGFSLFSTLIVMAGIGAIGVGVFTEDAGWIHVMFSSITFLFGGLAVIVSSIFQRRPMSYLAIALGGLSLVALILFVSANYLGLGKGGMERLIAYPALLWAVGFGGHLIDDSKDGAGKDDWCFDL